MKNKLKKYLLEIVTDIFCLKRDIREKILNIKFKKINYQEIKLNCFNSDDLSDLIDIHNEKFLNFFIHKESSSTLNFICINSINTSKTKTKYDTVYLFGKNVFLSMNWSYEECLEHISKETRMKPFDLKFFKWNNRYHWINGGGSHHFAMANFIATNNKFEHSIDCKVQAYEINLDIANKLLDKYEMFIFNNDFRNYARKIFKDDIEDIILLINGNVLILFDKEKSNNKGYLHLLKLFDKNYILYFNDYLKERMNNQLTYSF
ncbi:hypothetical protein PJV93_11340 [Aliarcobacter butzleri]|uniref:Uncharacterized protein n=1 Tax=Aliarcobacter butzleri TaxID=28197 RepID=A0AAW7QER9_9BACT|nr:DUF6685 family protein [Aliarcobacter butzleri]MDN5108092.1 hypothetical protein [Aliarcobacter butzleri]MDN5124501.1 hypothetical protein [Aliarcobacter butzleri]